MSVDLRTARFLNNVSQAQLCHKTGIHQSKLSLVENGLTTFSEGEKLKIVSVLGGHIDWKSTENQDNKCDFKMPQVDFSDNPEIGIKVRINKESTPRGGGIEFTPKRG